MSKQTAVRLPDETYQRLKNLAEKTGRTSTFYIRQAIEHHLEDLEDLYLAEETLALVREGKEPTFGLDEVERDLDLAG